VDPGTTDTAGIVRVIDGDTFEANVGGDAETIRFFGIDTPERGAPCFREATVRAEELLGSDALLVPDARERDRYGRLLRYVYTASGQSIDAALVREGYARAWRDDGALRGVLIELENTARGAQIGCLWSAGG
jgi:micrococcal nuclease